MKNLADFIIRIPRAIPVEMCKESISLYQNSKSWKRHSWYNPKKNEFNTYNEDCEILAPLEAFENEGISIALAHDLMTVVNAGIKHYCDTLAVGNIIRRVTLPRFNKYTEQTHMSPHYDHIQSLFDGKEKGIPILSITGNLNENYQGGEFVFGENFEVPLTTGDLLIFPSCFLYPHTVRKVKENVRHSFVCWAY